MVAVSSPRSGGPRRFLPVLLVVAVVLGVASTVGAQVEPPNSAAPAVWASSCVKPGSTELVVYGRGWAAGSVVIEVSNQNSTVLSRASASATDRAGVGAVFQSRVPLSVPGGASSLSLAANQPGRTAGHTIVVSQSCRPTVTGVIDAASCAENGQPVTVTITVRGAPTSEFDLLIHHIDLYGPAEKVDRLQPARPDGDYAFPLIVANVPDRVVPVTVEARRLGGSFEFVTTTLSLPPACGQPTTTTRRPTPTVTNTTRTTRATAPGPAPTAPPPSLSPPISVGSSPASLNLSPALGRSGEAMTVVGRGFAPFRPVTLHWRPGIGEWTVTPEADGTFRTQVLVLPNDVDGPRALEALGSGATPAPYLVVPGSEQPAFGGVFVRG